MLAHGPRSGAETPGAPSLEGQGLGAGGLAPGAASPEVRLGQAQEQLEELRRQFEELKKKFHDMCRPFVDAANASYWSHSTDPYDAWLSYAFNTYDYIISGIDPTGVDAMAEFIANTIKKNVSEVEERVKAVDDRTLSIKMESIRRVIKTCDMNQNFIDFADLKDEIRRAEKYAEEDEHEEILDLLEKMRTMTVGEFLEKWEDIVDELSEHDDYDNLIWGIYHGLEFNNLLGDALAEEIEYLARELLGATEKRAERLVECLVEC